jgi:hypothetical protein
MYETRLIWHAIRTSSTNTGSEIQKLFEGNVDKKKAHVAEYTQGVIFPEPPNRRENHPLSSLSGCFQYNLSNHV